MAAGVILGRAQDVRRQVRAVRHNQVPIQQETSTSSTRFKVVGGGRAEVVMRRCWVGFGEDRPLRLARLGDRDVEEAVLAIEEEIRDGMVGGERD